jgi:16S rRNA A1518/A1519 N6-dimethyltransferase RsmA/KsgA/DIM1 with predicted DNA glycosylase/AP lyase activity
VMGRSVGVSASAAPGATDYNRLSLKTQARFTPRLVTALSRNDFHPVARTPACIMHLVPLRAPDPVIAAVDSALTRFGGMKVKDLLWYLRRSSRALGPPSRGQQITSTLRGTSIVQSIYQRRLQEITALQLSHLMGELRRITDAVD